jgi:hypothetical protein
MSYVIYNLKTLKPLPNCRQAQRSYYDTMAAAKGTITRVATASETGKMRIDALKNFKAEDWAVADLETYVKTIRPEPKMVTVINLMSGLPIQIAEDTPRCCDPSTELYWSM